MRLLTRHPLALAVCFVGLGCGAAPAAQTPPATTERGTECAAQFASEAFATLTSDLQRLSEVEAWPGYRLASHDFLFEWLDGERACVAHWSKGEVVSAEPTPGPMHVMLRYFGFLLTDFANRPLDQRLGGLFVGDVAPHVITSLRQQDANAALVWVMNPDADGLDASPESTLPRLFLLAHESVHVHLQFARMFAGDERYTYPAWAVQPDRPALIERCFENELGRALHDAELAANALGVSAALRGEDPTPHAREFISARLRRYQALEGVVVPGQNGAEHSCAQAEAIWELEEGGADYIALRSMLEAGIDEAEAFAVDRVTGRTSGDADFYFTGAGQLLMLWRADPDAMSARLTRLAESERPEDGIFLLFLEHVEGSMEPPSVGSLRTVDPD